MRATEELRNDHETMREKLTQLKERLSLLKAAPGAQRGGGGTCGGGVTEGGVR